MAPRPPAPDTAATSCGAYTEPMPPSAMGCSICKRSHTGVRIIASPFGSLPMLARDRARARDLGEAAAIEREPLQRDDERAVVDGAAGERRKRGAARPYYCATTPSGAVSRLKAAANSARV